MKLTKNEYLDIIKTYHSRNTESLLSFFKKYPPNMVKKCLIKQIIKTTNDFNLAIELDDATTEIKLKCALMKAEVKDFMKVNEEEMINKYEKSLLKNDILKDELYLRFKPLFTSQIKLYRAYYFHFVFNIEIPILNGIRYKKQDFEDIVFSLSVYNDLEYLTKLFLMDKVNSNLYFGRDNIIIKSDSLPKKITTLDTQIEAMVFKKILSIDIESLNKVYIELINDETLDVARGELIYRYNTLSKIINKLKH